MNEEDLEIDEMTAEEVTIETCLEILRIAKVYGMHRAKQDARTLSLLEFEEVRSGRFLIISTLSASISYLPPKSVRLHNLC